MAPQAGDIAPDFTLPDQSGEPVTLSDLKGKTSSSTSIPRPTPRAAPPRRAGSETTAPTTRARTPWCWACQPDPVKAVSKFDQKYDLGFPLLSDEDHAVSEQYGTWVEKSMYGRKFMGVQRSTFIIDTDGKIAHVIAKASPQHPR